MQFDENDLNRNMPIKQMHTLQYDHDSDTDEEDHAQEDSFLEIQ